MKTIVKSQLVPSIANVEDISTKDKQSTTVPDEHITYLLRWENTLSLESRMCKIERDGGRKASPMYEVRQLLKDNPVLAASFDTMIQTYLRSMFHWGAMHDDVFRRLCEEDRHLATKVVVDRLKKTKSNRQAK